MKNWPRASTLVRVRVRSKVRVRTQVRVHAIGCTLGSGLGLLAKGVHLGKG